MKIRATALALLAASSFCANAAMAQTNDASHHGATNAAAADGSAATPQRHWFHEPHWFHKNKTGYHNRHSGHGGRTGNPAVDNVYFGH